MVPRPLATAILVVVCIVWVGNFAATVFVPGYVNDSAINFVFATIVGGALTLRGSGDAPGVLHRLSAVVRPIPPPPPSPYTAPPDTPADPADPAPAPRQGEDP